MVAGIVSIARCRARQDGIGSILWAYSMSPNRSTKSETVRHPMTFSRLFGSRLGTELNAQPWHRIAKRDGFGANAANIEVADASLLQDLPEQRSVNSEVISLCSGVAVNQLDKGYRLADGFRHDRLHAAAAAAAAEVVAPF